LCCAISARAVTNQTRAAPLFHPVSCQSVSRRRILISPYGGSNPPAPATHSLNLRTSPHVAQSPVFRGRLRGAEIGDRQNRVCRGGSVRPVSNADFPISGIAYQGRERAMLRFRSMKVQLGPRPGPQSFLSGATSRDPPNLQAGTPCRIGRMACPRGLNCRLRMGLLRPAETTCRYSDDAADMPIASIDVGAASP
jgi:hypothetical protein